MNDEISSLEYYERMSFIKTLIFKRLYGNNLKFKCLVSLNTTLTRTCIVCD